MTTTVVVTGVSGAGKTAIGRALAARLGVPFLDGDDLHAPASIAKMRAGIPLDDADRLPWLHRIAAWIGAHEAAGQNAVVACSALHRSYRDLLRDGHPSVWFLEVAVPAALLAERIGSRTGHFMPASLLGSQLATQQAREPDEPGATVVNDGPLDETVTAALALLPG